MTIDDEVYLNEKELATKYGFSLRWVRKIRYSGKDFPYYHLNGRVFYKKTEVDDWLKKNLIRK